MNQFLHIAICEDQAEDQRTLQEMAALCGQPCNIEIYSSGEAFLESAPAGRFQLVFLDVYMGGMTGVETARRLREADQDVQIAFITTSEDFALEGFQVGALQYLVKPVVTSDMNAVMKSCRIRLAGIAGPLVSLLVDGGVKQVPLKDIMYAEVYNRLCFVHLTDGVLEVQMSLDELTALLPAPGFCRCHRANVVNFAYVQDVDRDFTMKNGDTVYIRRDDVRKCTKAYREYLIDRAGHDD